MQVKSIITMIFPDAPPMQVGTPHDADVILKQIEAALVTGEPYIVTVVNNKNGVRSEKQILFPRKAISISVIDYNDTGLVVPDRSIKVVQ